ncbi:deaminase [Phytohabitans kaempferiae]|uniref:Deaminase n=1 Tax=Phytohabitans kaempferiae TaxID=1620943 RepID=A0ABV6MC29_9ACTN
MLAATDDTTMYTSCQPCGMRAGAIVRAGLGRVVYALSTDQLEALKPGGGWPAVPQEGPRPAPRGPRGGGRLLLTGRRRFGLVGARAVASPS